MIKRFNIYLSSTDFKWYEFKDKWWKFHFSTILDNINRTVYSNGRKYILDVYDPLQIITDNPSIVEKDLSKIRESSCVVCYIGKRLTIGTLMELSYCCYKNLPIILIDSHKIHRNHPWIKYWIRYIVNDVYEAFELIKTNFLNRED